jgi:hypothetical protein
MHANILSSVCFDLSFMKSDQQSHIKVSSQSILQAKDVPYDGQAGCVSGRI